VKTRITKRQARYAEGVIYATRMLSQQSGPFGAKEVINFVARAWVKATEVEARRRK